MSVAMKSASKELPPINLTDTCDRCRVRAYVSVRVRSGSVLHFCAYHFTLHEEVLFGCATDIRDERQMLMTES